MGHEKGLEAFARPPPRIDSDSREPDPQHFDSAELRSPTTCAWHMKLSSSARSPDEYAHVDLDVQARELGDLLASHHARRDRRS